MAQAINAGNCHGGQGISVGKPSAIMIVAARDEIGMHDDETTIIGDTMETDILGGVQLDYHSVLVLGGGTRAEDLPKYSFRPDNVVESLAEFADILEKTDWQPPWRAAKPRERRTIVG